MTTAESMEAQVGPDGERIARAGIPRLESDREVEVKQSAVGLVRAETVTINQAGVGAVVARGDVSVARGGGRMLLAGGDLRLHQGGGAMLVAGGDVEVREGGAGTMVALGGLRVEQGGSVLALARSVDARAGATIGVALSPRVTLEPGARVVLGPREVIIGAAVAGAVMGLVLGGLRRLLAR